MKCFMLLYITGYNVTVNDNNIINNQLITKKKNVFFP